MQRKPLLAALFAVLVVPIGATSASAATFSGTVVHKNARALSFVVALPNGSLRAIHARRTPALGRRVTVTARHLRNGTWALTRVRIGKVSHHVRVRGTVTYVSAKRDLFVVSARGVSLVVRLRARTHRASAAADSQITEGQAVTVDGTIDGNSLDAGAVHSDGQDGNGIDLEGTIQSIDTTGRTLSISADDSEQSGATLTVDVPASFDLSLFATGQSVELIVAPNGDGSYTLEQSANDSGAQNADNQAQNQGDGNGDNHVSAEQVCTAQQSDPTFAASHNGLTFDQFWAIGAENPSDAFGQCVDAMAHGTSANPSPELQCHLEANDPNFASTHSGESFAQFYNPQEPSNLNDALGHCVDTKAQQLDNQTPGSGPSAGGSGS